MEVPEALRPAIRRALDALVRGDRPDLLTWVHDYGTGGAKLANQPDEIWTHQYTSVVELGGGGWSVIVPLWTTDESPSDLSADIAVSADGIAEIHDVHVL